MASKQKELFTERQWNSAQHVLNLSPQQKAVSHNLLLGKSDKQIAWEMGIAVPTVRSHITRLFQKFNVNDRVELILHLIRCLQECQTNGAEAHVHRPLIAIPTRQTSTESPTSSL